MSKASREKGKRGEREAAKKLQEVFNCEARRGIQYSGSADSPDVVHSLEGIHIEVKRTERLKLWDALKQASDDAEHKLPVVMHRANNRPWIAIVNLDDIPKLVELLKDQCEQ